MAELRGFGATIQQHDSTVSDLLSRGLQPGQKPATVTCVNVEGYLQIKTKEVARKTLQHIAVYLRSYFCYCGDRD